MRSLIPFIWTISGVMSSISLGDGLWRTFGHQTALPTTAEEAESQGWVAISGCDNYLGILYTQDNSGPTEEHPLGLRYTASGAVAGVQATIFGSSKFGNAAPDNLVELGYWKVNNGTESWRMDISFRSSSDMCSDGVPSSLLGDRVVINQDTIAQSIPLTAKDAQERLWTPGSCMTVSQII